MSEIDWSKAPADATHYSPPKGHFIGLWAKLIDGVWHCYRNEHEGWYYGCQPEGDERFISRQEWNGEGLPPVGTVCEINGTVGQELRREEFSWRNVEIIAHTNFGGSDVAVGRDLECATLGWGIASKFRPIRTPEQIAAEEREKATDEMFTKFGGEYGLTRKQCAWVISEGYRKQEPPQ